MPAIVEFPTVVQDLMVQYADWLSGVVRGDSPGAVYDDHRSATARDDRRPGAGDVAAGGWDAHRDQAMEDPWSFPIGVARVCATHRPIIGTQDLQQPADREYHR